MEKNLSNMDGKKSIIAEKTSITAQKMSNTVPGVRHPPRFVRYPCEFPHIAECPPCPPNPFEPGNLTVTPYLRIGHYGSLNSAEKRRGTFPRSTSGGRRAGKKNPSMATPDDLDDPPYSPHLFFRQSRAKAGRPPFLCGKS
ncbi:hypothetical protein B4135_3549 [Caldibacillus debilis]|uniref:Uncharacterized protein n=1 Tax=Caldibacillus debilis TaxID=301148 RepID=A0A150LDN4_9BACI|nr:hypothetical protein B4135_3549 [Caldibacillus debilis]